MAVESYSDGNQQKQIRLKVVGNGMKREMRSHVNINCQKNITKLRLSCNNIIAPSL